jgi:hypothetical protein
VDACCMLYMCYFCLAAHMTLIPTVWLKRMWPATAKLALHVAGMPLEVDAGKSPHGRAKTPVLWHSFSLVVGDI